MFPLPFKHTDIFIQIQHPLADAYGSSLEVGISLPWKRLNVFKNTLWIKVLSPLNVVRDLLMRFVVYHIPLFAWKI